MKQIKLLTYIGFLSIVIFSSIKTENLYSQWNSCKIVLCACCGGRGITFGLYTVPGDTLLGTVTTGSDGCMDVNPIGPYPAGRTFYWMPLDCDEVAVKTYFTITCCPWNQVDTIRVLCCPSGDKNIKGNSDNINPQEFILYQNYPNPFNPATKIAFNIPEESFVNLTVFNTAGEKIATLISGEMNKGYHEITWDAGEQASGVYFYQLKSGPYTDEKKMILLK